MIDSAYNADRKARELDARTKAKLLIYSDIFALRQK